jgi:deoxyribonuclease-4
VVDEFDAKVGLERLRCLHVNDSQIPLGGNRDRHANIGEGELGDDGIATFISEPRFEALPALLEVPGPDGHGPDRAMIERTRELRRHGIRARA